MLRNANEAAVNRAIWFARPIALSVVVERVADTRENHGRKETWLGSLLRVAT